MHKKTRNGFLKAACFMLAAMALSAFAVCGTLAKYTSKGTFRPPTLTVATWTFKVNEESETFPGIVALSGLHWTVAPTSTDGSETSDNTIAPCTWGYAAITVQNVGDVDAYVTVSGVGFPTEDDAGNVIKDTIGSRLTFAVMTSTPTESAINGSTTLPEENSYLVRSGKSGTNSITFYLAYKWEFGTTADGANDNLFRGKIFEFGALSITAKQVEPNKALAYSQPMPHAARPTSTVSEVTDE